MGSENASKWFVLGTCSWEILATSTNFDPKTDFWGGKIDFSQTPQKSLKIHKVGERCSEMWAFHQTQNIWAHTRFLGFFGFFAQKHPNSSWWQFRAKTRKTPKKRVCAHFSRVGWKAHIPERLSPTLWIFSDFRCLCEKSIFPPKSPIFGGGSQNTGLNWPPKNTQRYSLKTHKVGGRPFGRWGFHPAHDIWAHTRFWGLLDF